MNRATRKWNVKNVGATMNNYVVETVTITIETDFATIHQVDCMANAALDLYDALHNLVTHSGQTLDSGAVNKAYEALKKADPRLITFNIP